MAENEAQSPSPPPANPALILTAAGRPKWNYCLPTRYEDVPPVEPAPIQSSPLPQMAPGSLALPQVILHVCNSMHTCYNSFGVLREYPHQPSYDPDTSVPEENLCNYPTPHPNPINTTLTNEHNHDPPWPFQNKSIYMLMEWLITGSSNKLIGEMDRLANVLRAKEFKLADLVDFSAHRENDRFDVSEHDLPDSPYSHDGWVVSDVPISVPTGLKELGGHGKPFIVPGLH